MAAKTCVGTLQMKSQSSKEPTSLNDDLEVAEDNSCNISDEASDGNNDDDDEDYCLDDLEEEDFDFKDFDADNVLLLNSRLYEETLTSDVGAADAKSSKTLHTEGVEVPNSEEEDVIDSDEEKAILKEIEDNFESKTCQQMTEGQMRTTDTDDVPWNYIEKGEEIEIKSEEDMDPRLLDAMMKMEKLDKILLKKIRIERDVKRSRILLEKRMREEIAEITKGVNIHQDIKTNTERFLALEPPHSHNEGVTLDVEDDFPPLFQTQLNEDGMMRNTNNGITNKQNQQSGSEAPVSKTGYRLKKKSRSNSSQPILETKGRKQKKDFIKRNKELATYAGQPIAMTDDEKQRLSELLEGVDQLSSSDEAVGENSAGQCKSNQVILLPGEGFCPDKTEMKSLANIDEKLKALIPADDYLTFVQPSIASSSVEAQQLFSRVDMQTQDSRVDHSEKYGERALFETKDERELKTRLESIEQELDKFKARNEDESNEECHLSDEQLENLLNQCARNFAMSTCPENPDLSARSIASSRLSLLENPPKLTEEQLQMLLSEAHFPMSSRIQFLMKDVETMLEEEGCTEAIKAETWKAIKDLDLNEDGVSSKETLSEIINIDHDFENDFNLADNISLNVSNNHNKAILTNNNETDSDSHISGQELEDVFSDVPSRYSSFDLIQTSVYSGYVANNLYGASGGLPRISHSNGVSRSESYLENISSLGMPLLLPRDNIEDAVRLPNISSKSFLVHAQQGMNNIKDKEKTNLLAKQSLEIICNDLSDVKTDNASNENEGPRGQNYGSNSLSRTTASTQSKPPLPKEWQPKG